MDYLIGGCEINLILSVDFTASNGDPKYPTSKHFRSPYAMNEYQNAIKAVGEILLQYDHDKMVPCFGFGAKVNGRVSQFFPLNGNADAPEVFGVEGMLEAYSAALGKVILSGPTNFASTVRHAAGEAQKGGNKYFVLLFITDGDISDMNETVAAIVAASILPLSIVIIGVGNADFAKMNFLDADDNPLVHNGVIAARDIVQFVPFRQFQNSPAKLAEATLKEIPEQVVSFYKSKNILPRGWGARSEVPIGHPVAQAPSNVFASGRWEIDPQGRQIFVPEAQVPAMGAVNPINMSQLQDIHVPSQSGISLVKEGDQPGLGPTPLYVPIDQSSINPIRLEKAINLQKTE